MPFVVLKNIQNAAAQFIPVACSRFDISLYFLSLFWFLFFCHIKYKLVVFTVFEHDASQKKSNNKKKHLTVIIVLLC